MDFYKSLLKRIKRILSKRKTIITFALIISGVCLLKTFKNKIDTVKLSYFLLALSENKVSEVLVKGPLVFFLSNSQWRKTDASLLSKDRLYRLLEKKEKLTFSSQAIHEAQDSLIGQIFVFGTSLLIGFFLVNYKGFNKGMGTKDYKDGLVSNTKFEDVYGLGFAKKELQEIIDFLKDPVKYENIGARLRRGVLIYGPPGTGKTLLAKVYILMNL